MSELLYYNVSNYEMLNGWLGHFLSKNYRIISYHILIKEETKHRHIFFIKQKESEEYLWRSDIYAKEIRSLNAM